MPSPGQQIITEFIQSIGTIVSLVASGFLGDLLNMFLQVVFSALGGSI